MEYAQHNDQQLVEQAKRGDKRAFDILVKKYQHKIMGLIGSYIHDFQEVQDVSQETFAKAYRAIGNFRGESAFYTWLYRIATNTAKNHLISRGRRPPLIDVDASDPEVCHRTAPLQEIATPENTLQKDQMEEAINRALRMLPDELRTAITLREFDGLSYENIARVMNCPVGTVRSRIFRAREAVDKVIQPLLGPAN